MQGKKCGRFTCLASGVGHSLLIVGIEQRCGAAVLMVGCVGQRA